MTKTHNRVGYFLDMGLGKTFVGSEKMYELDALYNLVVCQKSKVQDCQFGLVHHSRNVMMAAENIGYALLGKVKYEEIRDSVTIAAALHDLGKCGDYGKQMYVPNILKSGKASEAKPFKRNPALLPIDHATRSVKLATLFIDLTEDEEFAIRYHDGLYETADYGVKGHETPLYLILHYADLWSSRVTEGCTEEGSEE